MLIPIPYVHMGIGAATALISIPLVLRMIPMNRIYGIRTPKAFDSEYNWYALNAFGGRLLLYFGGFVLAFGYATRKIAPLPTSLWAPVFFVGPLLAIIPVLARIKAFARGLPDRKPPSSKNS